MTEIKKCVIKHWISQTGIMSMFCMQGWDFPSAVHMLMLLLHTVLLVLLMVGDGCQSCRHWRLCVTFLDPVLYTSTAVTSFNLRVVHIFWSRVCLTAIRIKERLVVVSQSSFIQLWKYMREKKWWESCFNSSLCFIPFISFSSPPLPPPSSPQCVSHLVPIPLCYIPTISFWLSGLLPLSLTSLDILSIYPLSSLSCQKLSLHLWGLCVIHLACLCLPCVTPSINWGQG